MAERFWLRVPHEAVFILRLRGWRVCFHGVHSYLQDGLAVGRRAQFFATWASP